MKFHNNHEHNRFNHLHTRKIKHPSEWRKVAHKHARCNKNNKQNFNAIYTQNIGLFRYAATTATRFKVVCWKYLVYLEKQKDNSSAGLLVRNTTNID